MRGGREPNVLVAVDSAARALIGDVADTILSYP